MTYHSAVPCAGRLRARPDGDVDHAAAAAGTDVEAPPGEERVALAIIGGFDLAGAVLERRERGAEFARACGRGMRWRGSRSGGCGGSPSGRTCSRKRRMNSSASSVIALDLSSGAIILPAEADAVVAVEKPAIGDGDAMGVAAEVVEDLCGTAERALGVDDPFDLRGAEIVGEGGRFASDASSPKKFSGRPSNAARSRSRNRRR